MNIHGDELRMYIIVNTDAKMGKGKACAQVSHAVMLITEFLLTNNPTLFNNYKNGGMPKLVLKSNHETLLSLESKYPNSFPIRDFGRTQVKPNTFTVLGFLPMTDSEKHNSYPELESLKLL